MNGIINVYKPLGITSFGVIARIRRILNIKKAGHTGTLDPMADGVLPVCIGKATKAAGLLTDKDKCYRAVMRLGITTDTQDAQGTVLTENKVKVTETEFCKAVKAFEGEIEQIPPMYSAVRVNGKRLYNLAREGIEIERAPRKITVYGIQIESFDGEYATIEVHCSKGTYIRTICHDIGQKLGCGAIMHELTRIKSGMFGIDTAVTIEEFEKNPEKYITPVDEIFEYPKYFANEIQTVKIKNGSPVYAEVTPGEKYRVYGNSGEFLCISEGIQGDIQTYLKMNTAFF